VNTAPTSPRFHEAMLPSIKEGCTSCANCRHFRVYQNRLNWDQIIPVVECFREHYAPRRIDRNIGPEFAEVCGLRAQDCCDFDHMGEES